LLSLASTAAQSIAAARTATFGCPHAQIAPLPAPPSPPPSSRVALPTAPLKHGHGRRAEQLPLSQFPSLWPSSAHAGTTFTFPRSRRSSPNSFPRRLPCRCSLATEAAAPSAAYPRGLAFSGHHGASRGHHWVRTDLLSLPHHCTATDEPSSGRSSELPTTSLF
jgi:hypothetical protein